MVPYEVRQVGWRASEAPERGAPWGAEGLWVAGGLLIFWMERVVPRHPKGGTFGRRRLVELMK